MDNEFSNLLNTAYNLHKKGRLSEAKDMYEQYLDKFPENPDALNLYAQLLFTLKEFDNALAVFHKVFNITGLESIKVNIARTYISKNDLDKAIAILSELNQKNKEVLSLSASIYTKKHQYNDAINMYKAILNINPNDYSILYNISLIYKLEGNINAALEFAQKAYAINSSDIDLLLHTASLYDAMKQYDKLVIYLEKVLEYKPNNETLLLKLAILNTQLKNLVKSVYYYEKCLEVNNNNFDSLVNLSAILSKTERYDLALELAMKARNLVPDNIRSHHSVYICYKEKRDWANAIETAENMIKLFNDNPLGYGCLADIYFEAVDYTLAIEYYEKALTLKPNDFDYLYNKAMCLDCLDRKEEAENLVKYLLSFAPNDVKYLLLSCYIKLKYRCYEEARDEYLFLISPESRHELQQNEKRNKLIIEAKFVEYYKKRWNNENIKDKTLLIYSNAGFGDYIMFSRYIPLLKNYSDNIIVEADKNLYKLFSQNFTNCTVIEEINEKPIEQYDYSASVMSLLYNLNLDFNNIPFSEGWLKPDEELKKQFAAYDIFKTDKIKAGIFFRGNKNILKNRAIKLDELTPLFDMDRYKFYSLDIVEKDENIQEIIQKYNIVDCAEYITNFADTSAILSNLDILITIDSSVLHLGGALGIKTYLMLPHNTEWRWFKDEKTTPWYDSVVIFKQKKQADWSDVVQKLKKELQNAALN